MNCWKCGASRNADESVCTQCGADLNAAQEHPAPEKKRGGKAIMTGILAVVLACVLFAAGLFVGPLLHKDPASEQPERETLDEPTDEPEETPFQQAMQLMEAGDTEAALKILEKLGEEAGNAPAAVIDGTVYSVADVSYYYQSAYWYEMTNGYGSYFIDTAQPLDAQAYVFDSSITWAQHFRNQAVSTLQLIHAVVKVAEAEGVTLNAAYQTSLDDQIAYVKNLAQESGVSYKTYLTSLYGKYMTPEVFERNLERTLLASQYSADYYDNLTFTDAEIEAFYQQNQENIDGGQRDTSPSYNVRHILITEANLNLSSGETAGEGEVALAAQTILDEWMNGDRTEESFAALAEKHTQDGGSRDNGGLYEDVLKGQMITEFNDWCYAEGRQAGDTGIVQTTYGYHIMYFVGYGEDEYWSTVSRAGLANETYTEWETDLAEGCVVELKDTMALVS